LLNLLSINKQTTNTQNILIKVTNAHHLGIQQKKDLQKKAKTEIKVDEPESSITILYTILSFSIIFNETLCGNLES